MTNNRRFLIWTEDKLSTANVFFASAGNDGKGSCGQIHTYDGHFHNPQAQTVMPVSYERSRHTMNIVGKDETDATAR